MPRGEFCWYVSQARSFSKAYTLHEDEAEWITDVLVQEMSDRNLLAFVASGTGLALSPIARRPPPAEHTWSSSPNWGVSPCQHRSNLSSAKTQRLEDRCHVDRSRLDQADLKLTSTAVCTSRSDTPSPAPVLPSAYGLSPSAPASGAEAPPGRTKSDTATLGAPFSVNLDFSRLSSRGRSPCAGMSARDPCCVPNPAGRREFPAATPRSASVLRQQARGGSPREQPAVTPPHIGSLREGETGPSTPADPDEAGQKDIASQDGSIAVSRTFSTGTSNVEGTLAASGIDSMHLSGQLLDSSAGTIALPDDRRGSPTLYSVIDARMSDSICFASPSPLLSD